MDISRLIDSLRYGFPYHGDRDRDCADILETIGDRASISEETKSHIRSECLSQLPGEDFLCGIIDQLQGLKGLKKAEIIDKIGHVVECLEDLQQCQANASAYAYDELVDCEIIYMTRKYLSKIEITALQQAGELLTKQQVIDKINKDAGCAVISGKSVIVKFIDYRGNPYAPEMFAYYISYNHAFLSERVASIYWPFTVGMQG